MKVKQFIHANQFHLYEGDKHILQSYGSKVVEINNGAIILGRDWDYSTTTSKHVYQFLEKYAHIITHDKTNKRAYIQKLIDNGIINYDENMY